ncbi:MAG: chemotaxis protein CheW [Deltaproteobacteria bacterium]|nr:chemotaxis protein CheW [Deltaproteobacteria bacterium]
MLVLLLRVGDRRYALDARDVVEVVPGVPLAPAPGAPEWIAGQLQHRDGVAPVIDLPRLHTGTPAAALLSTRLVLVRRDDGGLVALRVESATAVARVATPPRPGAPLALEDGETVELVRWTDLLPARAHADRPAPSS